MMSQGVNTMKSEHTPSAITRLKPKMGLKLFFLQHRHALHASLKRMWLTPLASFLTIAVIGIALAMPASLFVLLQNLQTVGGNVDDSEQISLFLKSNVDASQAKQLLHVIEANPNVASAQYISPEQGLKDFEQQSGFGNVLAELHSNPLPGVIEVRPGKSLQTPNAVQELLQYLQKLPEVDVAQLDMAWIKRLYAFIDLGKQTAIALGILLSLAVFLIIGNTIKLSIQNYRTEIEVIKLIGATRGFIRRPFLYTGIIYGAGGALFAYALVTVMLVSLEAPVENLTALYQTNFSLQGLTPMAIMILLGLGGLLGLFGSGSAIWRQLGKIEPE